MYIHPKKADGGVRKKLPSKNLALLGLRWQCKSYKISAYLLSKSIALQDTYFQWVHFFREAFLFRIEKIHLRST